MILSIVTSGSESQIWELQTSGYFELLPKMIHIRDYKLMTMVMLSIANILGCNPMKFKPGLDKYGLLNNLCLFLKENSNIFVHEKAR